MKESQRLPTIKKLIYIATFQATNSNIKYYKMKNFKILIAAATIITFGMMSCSKGDTGPAGPAGPAGPDSVTYSPWITLNTPYNTNDSLYEQSLTAASLTKGIIDSGVILTYINLNLTAGQYDVIPISSFSNEMVESYSVGTINILALDDFTGYSYRYVTIPGSVKTGPNSAERKIKGYTIKELKAMPYAQAQQVLADKN
jgi:hypothetical protein